MKDNKGLQKSFRRVMDSLIYDLNDSIVSICRDYGEGGRCGYFLSHKQIKDNDIVTVCGGPVYYHLQPLHTDREEGKDKNISVVSLTGDADISLAPGIWYWGFFDGKSSTIYIQAKETQH